jgi:transposase
MEEVFQNGMSINAARKKIGLKSSTAKQVIRKVKKQMKRSHFGSNI